jgi:hypothetical protein
MDGKMGNRTGKPNEIEYPFLGDNKNNNLPLPHLQSMEVQEIPFLTGESLF